ncbi:MAG: 4-alpha-glucanotransferase, partial [Propionibacteriaceae bacterium]
MVAGALRHSGGLRVDHILGMFRLWWLPMGQDASAGTYVRYDHEAMIGIIALEAYRAGAVVIGEDLGTIEPWVQDYLRRRGLLGTSILWFEGDGQGHPLQPELWREYCMASVTSHDLPPTAGYLNLDHVQLRDRLGLLTVPVDEELARSKADLDAWLTALVESGDLAERTDDIEQTVLALHRFITRTPARLLCVALVDAIGERKTQNQPGTWKEYPNWQVPLSGPDGAPVIVEDLFDNARALRLAAVLNGYEQRLNS